MSKINDFITEAGVYFLATVDGNQPKLRPLGSNYEEDGVVYFGIGDFKDVYKQIIANPKVEIVAYKDFKWLRYTGRVVIDDKPKIVEYFLNKYSNLKNIYNDKTGYKMVIFHLEDTEANLMDMLGNKTKL